MADLFDMAKEEGDDDTLEALIVDAEVRKVIEGMEFRRMFNNPMDPNNCFIDIQAGAGGTEARTGPRCCCASTCAIANAKASRSKSWKNPTARWPASRPPP
jgi:protein subunit release factor A